MKLLLFLTLGYCCIKEHTSSAASVSNGSNDLQETSQDAPAIINKSASDVALSLQPNIVHRVVTDVNSGGHKLADIVEDKDSGEVLKCKLLGDKNLINQLLKAVPDAVVTNATTAEMSAFIDKCGNDQYRSNILGTSLLDTLGTAINSLVIFPGTKWCGAGNVAKDDNDLGKARGTDLCCREHDLSDEGIPPFGSEHGITNTMIYTMKNCADDRNLFNCLLNDSSSTSEAVGTIFFDVLRTKCFEYGYPTICTDFNILLLLELQAPCENREEDTSKPKEWHTVSPPSFFKAYIERNKA